MTTLPRDSDNTPIPALRLNPNGAHALSPTTTTPARNTTAFDADTRVISVYATNDIYIKFGDNAVDATINDHFFPKGLYYDFAIGGDKTVQTQYISVLAVNADCSVYISEKQ